MKMKQWLARVLCSLMLTASPALLAGDDDRHLELLGFVEWIVLENPSLRLKARLDTGANTASLHAVNIEEFTRDGDDWVRFELPLHHHKETDDEDIEEASLSFERPIERTILVKRKGAESQHRHVVAMEFCLNGRDYEAQFSLTDRNRFTYPALLGRRFMGGQILVDSADSFQADGECDYSDLEEVAETHG
jgi:hypothetical protein